MPDTSVIITHAIDGNAELFPRVGDVLEINGQRRVITVVTIENTELDPQLTITVDPPFDVLIEPGMSIGLVRQYCATETSKISADDAYAKALAAAQAAAEKFCAYGVDSELQPIGSWWL